METYQNNIFDYKSHYILYKKNNIKHKISDDFLYNECFSSSSK